MESVKVYEDSYRELNKILKSNNTGKLEVDFTKLDEETAMEIRAVIKNTVTARKHKLYEVLQGVNK